LGDLRKQGLWNGKIPRKKEEDLEKTILSLSTSMEPTPLREEA
jgi:hypothetical protein